MDGLSTHGHIGAGRDTSAIEGRTPRPRTRRAFLLSECAQKLAERGRTVRMCYLAVQMKIGPNFSHKWRV